MSILADLAALPRLRLYMLLLAVALASALASSVLTISFLSALNAALHGGPLQREQLLTVVLLLVGATSTSYATQILMFKGSYDLVHDIRMLVVNSVANARLEGLERFGVDRIITVLTQDVRSLVSFAAFVPNATISSLIVLGAAVYLISLSPVIGGAVILGVALLTFAGVRLTKGAAHLGIAVARDEEVVRKRIGQLVGGAREVRLNVKRREMLLDRDLLPLSVAVAQNSMKMSRAFSRQDEIVRAASFGFFLITLFYAAAEPKFGFAGAGAVVIVLFFIQQPFQLINLGWERLTPFMVALRRLRELRAYLTPLQEVAQRDLPGSHDWSEITLSDASFQYGDGGFAIGPINVAVKRGELIFITGLNGAGKTTFSKALSGLYPLTGGAIRVDAEDVTTANLHAYRDRFAIVFADKFLFDELCPASNVDLAGARDLVREMKLEEKVSIQDDWRFTTTDLSTGQRDRLALIDLLVQRRDIMIFDEWPANQDPSFRLRFYEDVLPALKREGRTAIVISHDDRYYHLADRRWQFEEGRLHCH